MQAHFWHLTGVWKKDISAVEGALKPEVLLYDYYLNTIHQDVLDWQEKVE